jgi:hypothetical protein
MGKDTQRTQLFNARPGRTPGGCTGGDPRKLLQTAIVATEQGVWKGGYQALIVTLRNAVSASFSWRSIGV